MYLYTHRISLSTEALALDVIPDGDPVVRRGLPGGIPGCPMKTW